MGEVAVKYRLMPEDIDVNLDELEKSVKEIGKVYSVERVPIAFGLVALDVVFIVEDREGALDELESKLYKLRGIQNYEVVETHRLL